MPTKHIKPERRIVIVCTIYNSEKIVSTCYCNLRNKKIGNKNLRLYTNLTPEIIKQFNSISRQPLKARQPYLSFPIQHRVLLCPYDRKRQVGDTLFP